MKFREHRGGLAESMATVIELKTRRDLIAHIEKLLSPFCPQVANYHHVRVDFYCYDPRIDWDTYIVTLPWYPGVLGFTDGPCS